MRASEIRDGDRGLVGHARVVGRHAARRADWEKEDGTTTKFRCRDGENMHCDVHWYHAKFEIKIQPVYRLRDRERDCIMR